MAVASVRGSSLPGDPVARVRHLLASPRPAPHAPASIAGLEQEYSVRLAGRQVDFRDLIGDVAPGAAVRRFAFDADARIVPSGAVWTVDSPHAEIATAPHGLRPGVATRLARDALAERAALRRRLPGGVELRGYSTHLNAFATGVDGWALARHLAVTYAPAIMLLAERRESPGLLVRPRFKRLEIGTEYLETDADLVAAAVVVLAAVIAAWREVVDRAARDADDAPPVPPPLDGRAVRQTWQRPGLFIAPGAFGEDLYARGRAAVLRRADGSWEQAAARLTGTWAHLRPVAAGFARPDELALVDALVAGDRPTPLDRLAPVDPLVGPRQTAARHRRRASGAALVARRARGDLGLAPEYVTWDLAVLRVTHPRRDFFLRVPRSAASSLDRQWASGALDAPLGAYAARPATGSVATLDEPSPGLFDVVESPAAAAARMEPPKSSGPAGGKPKRRLLPPPLLVAPPPVPAAVPPPPPPPLAARRRPRWPWLLVPLTILLTITVLWLGFPQVPGPNRSPSSSVPATVLVTPAPDCPPGLAVASGCPVPSGVPSSSTCPAGAVCGSLSPGVPTSSPSVTPCPVGTVCATSTPSPSPTARPTRSPTPTPTPDRTGPSITRLSWTPPKIGVASGPTCGLGQTVKVSVLAVDPSGIKSVVLNYQRAQGTTVRATMKLSGGRYQVTLSTTNGPAAWQPAVGQASYQVQLSVTATDSKGNQRTTAVIAGFTVQVC